MSKMQIDFNNVRCSFIVYLLYILCVSGILNNELIESHRLQKEDKQQSYIENYIYTIAEIPGPNGVVADSLGNIHILAEPGYYMINYMDTKLIKIMEAPPSLTTMCMNKNSQIYFGTSYPCGIYTGSYKNYYSIVADDYGTCEYSGDNQKTSSIIEPNGLAIDNYNNIFVTDTYNNRILFLNMTSGIGNTIVGNTKDGYEGDNGPAIQASLSIPNGLAYDNNLNYLYIADTGNNCIRKVDLNTGKL